MRFLRFCIHSLKKKQKKLFPISVHGLACVHIENLSGPPLGPFIVILICYAKTRECDNVELVAYISELNNIFTL